VKDRSKNSLTQGAKVREIGVAGRLNGCETLCPAGAFIPCESVETDFVHQTHGVNGRTGYHESYL